MHIKVTFVGTANQTASFKTVTMTVTMNVILITLCIAYLCMVNTHGKLKKNSIYNSHTDVTKMTANAKRVEW